MKLYGYFRSSAAYRVRIALNLKKLPYEQSAVHLTKNGGWQWSEEFRAINPQKRVPALALSTGEVLLQSLAIIEYLDEIEPEPPLLPADPIARAQVRAVSQIMACDIHPLNNLVALNYLKGPAEARSGRRSTSGIATGSRRASRRSRRCCAPAPTVSARTSRSRTSASCRRCSTRGASRSTWRNIRRSPRSMPPA